MNEEFDQEFEIVDIDEKELKKTRSNRKPNVLLNFDSFINFVDDEFEVVDIDYDLAKQIENGERNKKHVHVNSFFDIPLNERTFFKNERADYALAYNLVHSRVMRLARKKIYFEITDDLNFGLLEKREREELKVMQFMITLDIEDPNDEAVIKFKQKHKMEV
jgi:hypothetical protein